MFLNAKDVEASMLAANNVYLIMYAISKGGNETISRSQPALERGGE